MQTNMKFAGVLFVLVLFFLPEGEFNSVNMLGEASPGCRAGYVRGYYSTNGSAIFYDDGPRCLDDTYVSVSAEPQKHLVLTQWLGPTTGCFDLFDDSLAVSTPTLCLGIQWNALGFLYSQWRKKLCLSYSLSRVCDFVNTRFFFFLHSWGGSSIIVQGLDSNLESYLRKIFPTACVTVSRSLSREGVYNLRVTIVRHGLTTRFTYRSWWGFADCENRCYAQHSSISVQGILGFLGFKESTSTRFLQSVVVFITDLQFAKSKKHRAWIFLQWVDKLLDIFNTGSSKVKLHDLLKPFVAPSSDNHIDLSDLIRDTDTWSEGSIEVQGLGDLAAYIKGILSSNSIRAGIQIVSLVWHALFVFGEGGIDWSHLSKWNAAFHSPLEEGLNFGSALYDRLCILVTCSYEFYQTGDPKVFLRNDTEVTKFLEDVEFIIQEITLVPVQAVLTTSLTDLETRATQLIVKGEDLRSRSKLSVRGSLTGALFQLRARVLELSTMIRSCSTRQAPFSVLIYGPPKIGKTSVTELLFSQFRAFNPKKRATHEGDDLPSNGVYTRTLKEEYWSCYMNSYWGIIYDDIGQTNPKVPEFALEINEIIQVVNNAMFFPNMAGVEEKGKRYVAPQFVVATSNNKDLNSYHAVRSPGAVLRRFPFVITPTVKPEFAAGQSLDHVKANGNYDLWNFTVEEVIIDTVNSRDIITYRPILTDATISSFLTWFNQASLAHFVSQSSSGDFVSQIRASGPCENCGLLQRFCSCSIDIQGLQRSFRWIMTLMTFGVALPFIGQALLLTVISWRLSVVGPLHYISLLTRIKFMSDFAGLRPQNSTLGIIRLFVNNLTKFNYLDTAILLGVSFGMHSRYQFGKLLSFQSSILDSVCEKFQTWFDPIYAQMLTRHARAQEFVNSNPKTITTIFTILSAAIFLVWFYKATSHVVPQGREDLTGIKPPDPPVNMDNPWRMSQPIAFNQFVPEAGCTTRPEAFDDMVLQHSAIVSFSDVRTTIRALNVFGRFWLFPAHYVRNSIKSNICTAHFTRARFVGAGSSYGGGTVTLDKSRVIYDSTSDFCLWETTLPPGPNLLPFMGNVPTRSYTVTALFMRMGIGLTKFVVSPFTVASTTSTDIAGYNGHAPNHQYLMGSYRHEFLSENGDCGSPVYMSEPGRCMLIGAHVGMDSTYPDIKFVSIYPFKWLTEMKLTSSCVVQGDMTMRDSRGGVLPLSDIHDRCPIRYDGVREDCTAIPIGKVVVPQTSFRSSVSDTLFRSFWEEKGFVTKKIRPIFKGYCPSWLPKRNFCLNLISKDFLDPEIVKKCADHYLSKLLTIPYSSRKNMVIIDEETNLYGSPGNAFINPMEMSSGAGFPHFKPKSKVLQPCSHERFPHGTFALTPEIRKNIEGAEDKLSHGIRPNFVFNASLKDEPISAEKMRIGKIRVFQAINLEGLFLLRKYFLAGIACLQSWNFISEAAIGMDATGPDWDDVHNYVNQPGWSFFCGDYKNYDQSMSATILEASWMVLIDFIRSSLNFPDIAMQVMQGLAIECIYAIINLFGDLICLNGTNPSGHALTVVINSIANSLYIRYAYFVIMGDLTDFEKYVRLITYGDDNVVSVHDAIKAKFNQVTVAAALLQIGVTYTDAEKTGDIKPFSSSLSFLKRSFIFNGAFYYAPLELDSIHRMLLLGVRSRSVQLEEQSADVLLSALREMFHYGRQTFEHHRNLTIECATRYSLLDWVNLKGGFPTFDMLWDARLSKVSRQHLMCKFYPISDVVAQAVDRPFTQVLNQRVTTIVVTYHEHLGNEFMPVRWDNCGGTWGKPPNVFLDRKWFHLFTSCNWLDESLPVQVRLAALYKFFEKDSGPKVGRVSTTPKDVTTLDRGDYVDFFSRPVLIRTYNWIEGSALTLDSFSPWYDYFSKPMVWAKIQGFSRLRCNLHLKVVVNGSPFRYGDVMFSYKPLWCDVGSSTTNHYSNATLPFFSGGVCLADISPSIAVAAPCLQVGTYTITDGVFTRSQRLHAHVLPATSTGFEMALPFIHYLDAIELKDNLANSSTAQYSTTEMNLRSMGTIHIDEVVPLRSTAAASSDPLTITVYAWASDVEIWAPTGLTVQGADEFQDVVTKPSTVASTVADAASLLESVPVIRPFALATKMACSAVSSILKLFGFSNPPVISSRLPSCLKTSSFLNPNPLVSFPDDVVALDPKNEQTIDPDTVGCGSIDELVVTKFCARPTIFDDGIEWTAADGQYTPLGVFPVSPEYMYGYDVDNPTTTPSQDLVRYAMTPSCYLAQLFDYWRGTFCLRLRVVCSQFHRGRIAIAWEPNCSNSSPALTSPSMITDVLDLASSNEITFKVPYMANHGMLSTFRGAANKFTATKVDQVGWGVRTLTPITVSGFDSSQYYNGYIYVYVLNELQVADVTADVTIVAETWMEDMIFSSPASDCCLFTGNPGFPSSGGVCDFSLTNFTAQGIEVPDGAQSADDITESTTPSMMISRVFGGEVIPSLRSLLHRSYQYYTFTSFNSVTDNCGYMGVRTFARFPLFNNTRSLQYNDTIAAADLNRGTSMSTNNFRTTPIAYITACYIGYRGSMCWKVGSPDTLTGGPSIVYLARTALAFLNNVYNGEVSCVTVAKAAYLFKNFFGSGLSGGAYASSNPNIHAAGVFPMYSNIRMFPGNLGLGGRYLNTDNKFKFPESLKHDFLSAVVYYPPPNGLGLSNSPIPYVMEGPRYRKLMLSVSAGTDFAPFGFVSIPDVYASIKN